MVSNLVKIVRTLLSVVLQVSALRKPRTRSPQPVVVDVHGNDEILASAVALLEGDVEAPEEGGYCLQLVRLVIEDGFGWKPHEFYARYWDKKVRRGQGDSDLVPWARDLERSLRAADFGVLFPPEGERYVPSTTILKDGKPGDLLFRWDTALSEGGEYIGHVGILMSDGLVLENINPGYRPYSFKNGATALTPVVDFPVTTVVRFNPEL